MKNIIFDRDGIINHVVMRNGSPSSPWKKDEFSFNTDIFSIVKKLHLHKYQIFIGQYFCQAGRSIVMLIVVTFVKL